MNRRRFLQASAATVALTALPHYAAEFADQKKRVGLIGTGWYGKCDLLRLIQVAPVEVVSLCDVDKKMLGDAAELVASRQASKKKPRTHGDYREMLKEKDLDLVLIGTPDHWHALAMIEAAKSGCDVWVQKPTSVDVVESLAMLAAARKYLRRNLLLLAHAQPRHARHRARHAAARESGLRDVDRPCAAAAV
jgi:predicted dehydrogenase